MQHIVATFGLDEWTRVYVTCIARNLYFCVRRASWVPCISYGNVNKSPYFVSVVILCILCDHTLLIMRFPRIEEAHQ